MKACNQCGIQLKFWQSNILGASLCKACKASQPPTLDYAYTPDGKKRYLKATVGDIILSVILPFYGLAIGLIALCKGEKARAFTMLTIGVGVLGLLVLSSLLPHR